MGAHRRRIGAMTAAVLLGILGVAACDGEGLPELSLPAATEPEAPTEPTEAPPEATDAPPETEAPAQTDAPPETEAPPAATDAPDSGETEDDDGTPSWLLPVLLGGLLVLVLVLALASRRRPKPAPAGDDGGRQALAMAAWIHDQLTLEVLALPAADAQRRWATERPRLDQLGIDARVLAASGNTEMWTRLITVLGELETSIDTAVRLKATEGVDQQMADEAVAIANRHRAELGTWVAQARSFI